MTIDDLKAGFALLADPVVPVEDPYGRLLSRARRSRRTRLAALAAAVVAVLVAALLAPALAPAHPSPTPSKGTGTDHGDAITSWARRLLDSPPRGDLAHDRRFVTDLTAGVRNGWLGLAPDLDRQTVLFAADAGAYRAVLDVFHSDVAARPVWLVGPKRTSADAFVRAAHDDVKSQLNPKTRYGPIQFLPGELAPYAATVVSDVAPDRYLAVGVAPAGCKVATRDLQHSDAWQPLPTGDYVVRTDPLVTDWSTMVQVSCAGVVRYQDLIGGVGRSSVTPHRPTPQQLDSALRGVRGTTPSRTAVVNALTDLGGFLRLTTACRALYQGPVPGAADARTGPDEVIHRPAVLVTACATTHGNTAFNVATTDGRGGGGGQVTRAKLTDPHTVFAVRGIRNTERTGTAPGGQTSHDTTAAADDHVLVLAPPAATVLQVVRGVTVVQSVPLDNGVGGLTVPFDQTVQVRALDVAGTVVGSGAAPLGERVAEETPALPDATVDHWS